MRTVYATVLEIGSEADITTTLNDIGRWIQDRYQRQRLSVDVFQSLAQEQGEVALHPVEGHELSVRHLASQQVPGERLLDLRWAHPDHHDASLGWVTVLSLLRHGGGLLLSVEVAVTGLQRVIAPADFSFGAPRVVGDIARLRSVRLGGQPYRLVAALVDAEHVEELVGELKDPLRACPIVVVSRRLHDDLPPTDSIELAERLAGVARVHELADKWAAFRLTEELGKPLSCFGGAVRIYWPRFDTRADPYAHPLWMPRQLKDARALDWSMDQLCHTVFDASAFTHVEPPAVSRLRSAAEREARESARSGNTKSEDDLLLDLIEMERRLEAAQAAVADLMQDNKTLRANAAALLAQAGGPVPPPPAQAPEAAGPASVEEAVRQAELRSGCVRYLPSAHASAAASPYRQPERVQQALAALDEVAALWAETIGTGKQARPLRELFKARGFDYADAVSQTARGKWPGEYTASYKGQDIDISPHITLGAKSADTCISIHWAWLRDEKVAVVAHVGRHKTNTKS